MGIVPYRISRLSQIRGLLREHALLLIIVGQFLALVLTDMLWMAILPPWGYITWLVTAQIFYYWASPRWKARFPRITKSMLRGQISKLNRLLVMKNKVIQGYFKSIEFYQKENKRLGIEIEDLKKEIAEIEEARMLTVEVPESWLKEELLESPKSRE